MGEINLEESMEASRELMGLHESFKIKVTALYRDKLISQGMHSNLMLSLRDIYYTVQSNLLAQERAFNRDGGKFYNSLQGKNGMYIRR